MLTLLLVAGVAVVVGIWLAGWQAGDFQVQWQKGVEGTMGATWCKAWHTACTGEGDTVGVEVEIGVEIFIIDFKCIDYLS